ncbi:MAG: hypothetical protein ACAH80_04840 [Alphaproteobacteria bacterium]
MPQLTREQFYEKLKTASQEEKNAALFGMLENVQCEDFAAVYKAGGRINQGNDDFAYAVKRVENVQMTNTLLDLGLRAGSIRQKDLWFMFDGEVTKDEAYATLGRIIKAGMDDVERQKCAASALKNGDFQYIEAYILKPGEDAALLINSPGFGQLSCAWNQNDTRPVHQDDIDKYIEWKHSMGNLYKTHFEGGITEAKLSEAVTKEGTTGLMMAVRAGKFGEVLDFYRKGGATPDPDEFTKADAYGQTVVSLLGHRSQLGALFDPALWKSRPEDALFLLEEIPGMYKGQVDSVKITRDMANLRLGGAAAAPAAKK